MLNIEAFSFAGNELLLSSVKAGYRTALYFINLFVLFFFLFQKCSFLNVHSVLWSTAAEMCP